MSTNNNWQDQHLADVTEIMREADEIFQKVGGSTRHYLRDALFPMLQERGFELKKSDELGEMEKLKAENERMRKDIAKKVLLAAAALVNEDRDEAYHHLYLIADPTLKHLTDPWQDLEAIAGVTLHELAKEMTDSKTKTS